MTLLRATLQQWCVCVCSGMFVPVKRGPVFIPARAPVMLQTPRIWTCLLLSCVLTSHTADGLKSLFLQHQHFRNKTAMALMSNANLPKIPH